MKQFKLFSILVSTLLISVLSSADQYFSNTRHDFSVPEHCREMDMSFFPRVNEIDFILYGIEGASRRGFDYEIDLGRREASYLWGVMKGDSHDKSRIHRYFKGHPRAEDAYGNLLRASKNFDFSWNSEGEILEALALIDLMDSLSDEYYVTGGVEYHETHGRILGELDIIVAQSSDCQVVMIGEAKLGNKKGKASRQLQRIRNFISRH